MSHTFFIQPAEWEQHSACWLAWPSHADLWQSNLKPAQREFAGLCLAISADGGEALEILVPDESVLREATEALQGTNARFHVVPFGDIWLRDTAPIFVRDSSGHLATAGFDFNGWGGKYVLDHDSEVSEAIAKLADLPTRRFDLILEGGSVEPDGEGTILTTRQCLLNPNRNPSMNQSKIEGVLSETLGARKVLWLGDGLLNDHTDGHIDTLARFTAPGSVVCMEARNSDDPNREVLNRIAADLESFTDAKGRKLKVTRIPSPGRLLNDDGDVVPASYVNFYIGNKTVVVPVYGARFDDEAVSGIAKLFPTRKVVGLRARAILSGGGAFHCITQQVPEAK